MIILFFLPFTPFFLWSVAGQWRYPDLLPTLSFRSWQYVFNPSSQVFLAIKNSLWLAVSTAILAQIIAYPAARALGLYMNKYKKTIQVLLFAPIIIPNISMAIGVHVLFIRLGLSDNWYGLLFSHLIPAIPYSMYLLHSFYSSYDMKYEQQYRLLGANWRRTFWDVELPMIRPVMALSIFFSFLISWSQYLFSVFIGGGSYITLPMLLFSSMSSGDFSLIGVLGIIFVIPALIIVIFSSIWIKQDLFATKGMV